MGEEFLVSTGYQGYVFVGWAAGQFKNDKGQMTPYANMFVLSPVSSFESEDYKAFGMKAEKKEVPFSGGLEGYRNLCPC